MKGTLDEYAARWFMSFDTWLDEGRNNVFVHDYRQNARAGDMTRFAIMESQLGVPHWGWPWNLSPRGTRIEEFMKLVRANPNIVRSLLLDPTWEFHTLVRPTMKVWLDSLGD